MKFYLRERIGNPKLFSGRHEELGYFLKWIRDVKEEKSKSTAILARRKMGKTALMERLFNIAFFCNDGVIPFYYEIKEGKIWALDFCKDFFLTFVYQYIAFKTRKREYLIPAERSNFDTVMEIASREGLEYLNDFIKSVAHAAANESVGTMWLLVRNFPRDLADRRGEFIVQMIDEFQFLNSEIYRDKEILKRRGRRVPGKIPAHQGKGKPNPRDRVYLFP